MYIYIYIFVHWGSHTTYHLRNYEIANDGESRFAMKSHDFDAEALNDAALAAAQSCMMSSTYAQDMPRNGTGVRGVCQID